MLFVVDVINVRSLRSVLLYTHVFQAVSGSRTADKQRCETLSAQG